jgi:cell division protein YceG involved in septum cleavage
MEPEMYHIDESTEQIPEKSSGVFRYTILFVCGIIIAGFLSFISISSAPKDFVKDTVITVYPGMTISDLATLLENNHVIKSATWFRLALSTRIRPKPIVIGDYIFEKPQPVFSVAYRLTRGIYGNSRVKVTFPEGITVKSMADILSKHIPTFPVADFLMITKDKEGYLFPETYYFSEQQLRNKL